MYNNHPDYLFHLLRVVVDRAIPDALLTHKDPMTHAMQDHKTITEVWREGDSYTLGLYQRPFYLLWDEPNSPLRLPFGVDRSTVTVNGLAVPETLFDLGHNLLLPLDNPVTPELPYPYPDDPNATMRQNYPVRDARQLDRRPGASKVVMGIIEEGMRGIAYDSDDYVIEVFGKADMSGRPLGVFAKSGLQVQVEKTRQGINRVTLHAEPDWPRPLYLRYKVIPQRLITFRLAMREHGMSENGGGAGNRKKPTLMGYTDDKQFQIFSQWFRNEVDMDCWSIEPMEAMRLVEELRLAMLDHSGFLREMGLSDVLFQKAFSMENMVLPNRDAMERSNYWTRYRATFFFRTEERHLVPSRPLYELKTTIRVESDI